MAAMVVIRCPETDREVPVGVSTDLLNFHRLRDGYAAVHCPYCNRHHTWSKQGAYLSITLNTPIRRRTKDGRSLR
jgi:hypothetical protein